MTAAQRLFVALDVERLSLAETFVNALKGTGCGFKVGLELLSAEGVPRVLGWIQELAPEASIFCDVKFHDIPNTVAGASRAVSRRGISMFNIHVLGGSRMMRATREAIDKTFVDPRNRPKILAMTLLTSHTFDELEELHIVEPVDIADPVARAAEEAKQISKRAVEYALLGRNAGLDGAIASAKVAQSIRQAWLEAIIVTPGIRLAGSEQHDQSQAQTPTEAIKAGADFLVVGRPITGAMDPDKAADQIIREIEQALTEAGVSGR